MHCTHQITIKHGNGNLYICVCLYVRMFVQVFSAQTCLALHVECVCKDK